MSFESAPVIYVPVHFFMGFINFRVFSIPTSREVLGSHPSNFFALDRSQMSREISL